MKKKMRPSLDDINQVTQKNILPGIVDNLFRESPIWKIGTSVSPLQRDLESVAKALDDLVMNKGRELAGLNEEAAKELQRALVAALTLAEAERLKAKLDQEKNMFVASYNFTGPVQLPVSQGVITNLTSPTKGDE